MNLYLFGDGEGNWYQGRSPTGKVKMAREFVDGHFFTEQSKEDAEDCFDLGLKLYCVEVTDPALVDFPSPRTPTAHMSRMNFGYSTELASLGIHMDGSYGLYRGTSNGGKTVAVDPLTLLELKTLVNGSEDAFMLNEGRTLLAMYVGAILSLSEGNQQIIDAAVRPSTLCDFLSTCSTLVPKKVLELLELDMGNPLVLTEDGIKNIGASLRDVAIVVDDHVRTILSFGTQGLAVQYRDSGVIREQTLQFPSEGCISPCNFQYTQTMLSLLWPVVLASIGVYPSNGEFIDVLPLDAIERYTANLLPVRTVGHLTDIINSFKI